MIALIPNTGFLSETTRMIAIGRALAARGVDVAFATHDGPYTHLIEEAGFSSLALAPRFDADAHHAFLDALLTLGREKRAFHPPGFLDEAVRAEADFLRAVGAKAVCIGFNLSTFISARVADVPVVTSHGGVFLAPVLERGLCPVAVNPPKPEAAKLPRFMQRFLANKIPFLMGPPGELNDAARAFGVEGLPSFVSMMSGDLTLVTEAPEVLGIPEHELHAWRPRSKRVRPSTTMRYTGPLFAQIDRPIPERVARFLDDGPPPVFVSPTSVRPDFLRGLVAAVKATGARVLVGATIHDVRDLEDARTLVEGVMPNHLVMPKVAVAVIMGGQGSVQTAMASGTPFVGMPYHGEQELNVHLAEKLGMAIRISPNDAHTAKLTGAVRRLLDDEVARASAVRVPALYARIDGAKNAADAIVTYLSERGVTLPTRARMPRTAAPSAHARLVTPDTSASHAATTTG